eukprot:1186349-Prorocentrum_minimum.AAC.1
MIVVTASQGSLTNFFSRASASPRVADAPPPAQSTDPPPPPKTPSSVFEQHRGSYTWLCMDEESQLLHCSDCMDSEYDTLPSGNRNPFASSEGRTFTGATQKLQSCPSKHRQATGIV